ncbi:MAG: S-methyl-5-thioribose-1-phosphate isomerase, partial [Candidatus Lokiarchaeota archaeon]|nr:S-methyl-5-thioribose-1-phosphate isomerase [Candidatus Lokiarchaeota archaeon]
MIPSIEWINQNNRSLVRIIDQTILPHELKFLEFSDYRDVAKSIKVMNIRGAPAIGVAAAMGMALAALDYKDLPKEEFIGKMEEAAEIIRNTRPTASNLFWAIN